MLTNNLKLIEESHYALSVVYACGGRGIVEDLYPHDSRVGVKIAHGKFSDMHKEYVIYLASSGRVIARYPIELVICIKQVNKKKR